MSTEAPRAPIPPRPTAPPRVPAQSAGHGQDTPEGRQAPSTDAAAAAAPPSAQAPAPAASAAPAAANPSAGGARSGAPSPVLPYGDVRFTAGGLAPYGPRPSGGGYFSRERGTAAAPPPPPRTEAPVPAPARPLPPAAAPAPEPKRAPEREPEPARTPEPKPEPKPAPAAAPVAAPVAETPAVPRPAPAPAVPRPAEPPRADERVAERRPAASVQAPPPPAAPPFPAPPAMPPVGPGPGLPSASGTTPRTTPVPPTGLPRPAASNSPFPTPFLISGSRAPYAPPVPAAPPAVPPRPARPPAMPSAPAAPTVFPWAAGPAGTPSESTARLRPVPVRRPARAAAAVACVVLGVGLIGGAVTGSWLTGDSAAEPAARDDFAVARGLWHSVPVDTLFPRTLKGDGAGPGAADRRWTRIGVAPDSGCAGALDPLLERVLRPLGCSRVVRATYVDATSSSVTTVGLVFTQGDANAMAALRTRFRVDDLTERTDLMPRTYPVEGTVAGTFGDAQRASWTVNVLTEVPVVVFAVSGFADGRPVASPQPADHAMVNGATTPAAQAGLGHEAKGVADRIERGLRTAVDAGTVAPR
ncbi:hypothetical protein ACIQVO_32750 [Streptomyces sp. NPDC101062]|uniref:hypothetical protein n=1 Tax=unclassified Streptomyces TaxID=2593676 RepID=UPI002E75B2A2|nr:hypothetical protein [Streptomyces sp. JV176]MEE1800079.1 hypothetical protein [Streptomyces sp. JV176]